MHTQIRLDKLRLRCDLFLMSGEKKNALQVYETMLDITPDPLLYTAKAKLLELLYEDSKAVEAFEKALDIMANDEKERIELLRLMLEMDNSAGGIIKILSQKNMASQKNSILYDADRTAYANENLDKTEIVARTSCTNVEQIGPDDVSQDSSERLQIKNFGRYNILQKLGEGGMGIVYKACDMEIERIVALKVIFPQYAQRFLLEVKATACLRHPNIVSIYDFGDNPQHYFTMEYLEGKTLSQWIHEGIFKPQKAAQALESICSAIECAHKSKIIHRDLKPSNVMMDETGNIKVMDFGLAKIIGSESYLLSRTGDVLGTPSYISPEQATGKQVDERSDVYSIGAIGYEMLTGRPVFKGDSLFDILHQVSNQEPLHPQAINANVDVEIETIILKCLEKSPTKRYQSVTELREELQRYLTNRPIIAKPPTPFTRILKWVKRNREISLAAMVVVLSILSVFFYITYQWIQQIRHNFALNVIREVMQWDKDEVIYETEAKQMFERAEKYSRRDIIYQTWGLFCFQYAQTKLHKAQLEHKEISQEYIELRDKYYREAMDKFNKAFTLNSCDYTSLYYMIFILYAWEKNELAYKYEDMLSKIVKRMPTDSGVKSQTIAIENLNQSYKASGKVKEGMQDDALKNYRDAIRYDPKLPCSHNGLGIIYRERKEYALAKKHLDICIQLTPTYRYAFFNRGRLYLQMGLDYKNDPKSAEYFQNAQDNFKTVIDLNPIGDVYYKQVTVKDVYYYLAQTYALQGKEEEAIQSLNLAVQNGFDVEQIKKDPILRVYR